MARTTGPESDPGPGPSPTPAPEAHPKNPPEQVRAFLVMVAAGVAGNSTHMMSSAVLALARLVRAYTLTPTFTLTLALALTLTPTPTPT